MPTRPVAIFILLWTTTALAADSSLPAIIPLPQKMEWRAGAFELGPKTRIVVDPAARETGQYLASRLRQATGFPLELGTNAETPSVPGGILLTTRAASTNLGTEGYELEIGPDAVILRAPQPAGLFYGAQSLLQLLPPEVCAAQPAAGVTWRMPGVRIEDQPRFPWRGLMLDVSRHFFSKQEVEQLLDAMARLKLNTFHWHLVDDQGWRLAIRKYPRLTEAGAWRSAIGFGLGPDASVAYGPDGRYGGFYTQADIREVVAYAAARHITIVPEIEMPGHSTAALSAYPGLSCTGGPFTPPLKGGIFNGIYCVGNGDSLEFVQNILAEVCELFPGKYLHVGGDEVPAGNWKGCAKCQALMKAEGLTREIELESWFLRRVEKFINARGRTLIGWSEIREGGLAQNAAIMDWIGGAVEAASAGHDVVMTPQGYCYFDRYQSTNHAAEPRAMGGTLPLRRVYDFEPVPAGLAPQFQARILGVQANVWTEYIPSLPRAEYMIFPRLCALAEIAWSPKSTRDWDGFKNRLQLFTQRLDQAGINYRRASLNEAE